MKRIVLLALFVVLSPSTIAAAVERWRLASVENGKLIAQQAELIDLVRARTVFNLGEAKMTLRRRMGAWPTRIEDQE